jgi:hypothetical protein
MSQVGHLTADQSPSLVRRSVFSEPLRNPAFVPARDPRATWVPYPGLGGTSPGGSESGGVEPIGQRASRVRAREVCGEGWAFRSAHRDKWLFYRKPPELLSVVPHPFEGVSGPFLGGFSDFPAGPISRGNSRAALSKPLKQKGPASRISRLLMPRASQVRHGGPDFS